MASKYSDNDDVLQHNQRVSDFDTKTCEYLLPIKGYEKQPLVSLEEAIEPLVLCVPGVKQMAHLAKRACKKPPADGLTVDESASIMLYSMDWQPQKECLYHVLNATLRAKNRGKLVPWFSYLPRSKNTGRFRQESTGSHRNVEAVFQPENFRIFSDDFRPVPAGKHRELIGIHWKKIQ